MDHMLPPALIIGQTYSNSKRRMKKKTPQEMVTDNTGHVLQITEFMSFVLKNTWALFLPSICKDFLNTTEKKPQKS